MACPCFCPGHSYVKIARNKNVSVIDFITTDAVKSSLVHDDGHGEAINKGLCPVEPCRVARHQMEVVASINRAISFFIRLFQLATWLSSRYIFFLPSVAIMTATRGLNSSRTQHGK